MVHTVTPFQTLDSFYDLIFPIKDSGFVALVNKDNTLKPMVVEVEKPMIQDFFSLNDEDNKAVLLAVNMIKKQGKKIEVKISPEIENLIKDFSFDKKIQIYPASYFSF